MGAIKVASLFCGCGGMDLGIIGGFSFLGKAYGRNPFEIVYAVDNDEYCTQIYNANFVHKCLVKDVRDIEILSMPEFDMLIGGFPCQSFSISAQNPPRLGYKDERGVLFFEMVKFLKIRKPRFFVAENVKGILSANEGKAFPMIIKEFKNAGYTVVYKLLNAYEYGVPQKRERVIIVGFRDVDDYCKFQYPQKVRSDERKVLGDVINEEENSNGGLFFSDKAVAGMMTVREKMNKGRAMRLDEPCNTISAHLAKVSLNSTAPVYMVGDRYRRFSAREAARIQSFPDTFNLDAVSQIRQYKAIGNAVPPVLMWHIANALNWHLSLSEKKKHKELASYVVQLGNADSNDWTQMSLFEPQALYVCNKDRTTLIGSCRQGTKKWITTNMMYNYPITDEEIEEHKELFGVNRLVVVHKKTIVGHYIVDNVQIVDRKWLAEHSYPTKSSRHKADTKYLLFSLGGTSESVVNLDLNDSSLILGKGSKSSLR